MSMPVESIMSMLTAAAREDESTLAAEIAERIKSPRDALQFTVSTTITAASLAKLSKQVMSEGVTFGTAPDQAAEGSADLAAIRMLVCELNDDRAMVIDLAAVHVMQGQEAAEDLIGSVLGIFVGIHRKAALRGCSLI